MKSITEQVLKKIARQKLVDKFRYISRNWRRKRLSKLPFTIDNLVFVLRDICKIRKGDILFVHSSVENLMIDAPVHRVIEVLMEFVGSEGTIMMPSYPKIPSYQFLKGGEIWDVRNAPSYTGLLTEIFRRMEGTRRSLHPTKSVAVWGKLRDELISEHYQEVNPYSTKSPYFKFIERQGKAIGIGVSAFYMSFVHAIDDYMGSDFPVDVYHKELLEGRVVDYDGKEKVVQTLAHDSVKMKHDIIGFIKRYLHKEQGDSFTYRCRDFFNVDAKAFFDIGVKLARKGITIYKKSVYTKK